jgi:hypothetical protein
MVQYPGACACEGVKYNVEQEGLKSVSACHCLTCQAWTGGISLWFEAAGPNVKVTEGQDNLAAWKSSDYCERVFCKQCGSSLYCRMTMPGSPMDNVHFFAAGTLKNWDGIDKIETEMFIDRKPAVYSLEGTADRKTMTAAEFYEMVSNHDCPSHEKKEDESKEEK